MAITHKIYSSRSNNNDSEVYVGEAGRLFYAQTTGTGVATTLRYSDGVTPGGLPLTGDSISVSGNPPEHPYEGNLWYDDDDGRLYIYYDNTWVDASPDTGYTLRAATTSTLGGVKVDGATIVIDEFGVISAVIPADDDSTYASTSYVDNRFGTYTTHVLTSSTAVAMLTSDGTLTLPSTGGYINTLYTDNGGSRSKLEKKIESTTTTGVIAKLELDLDNTHIRLAIGNYENSNSQWIDNTWAFGADGILTLPNTATITNNVGNITIESNTGFVNLVSGPHTFTFDADTVGRLIMPDYGLIAAPTQVSIFAGNTQTEIGKTWTFNNAGNLTLPDTTKLNSGGVNVRNSAEIKTTVDRDGSDTSIINYSSIALQAGNGGISSQVFGPWTGGADGSGGPTLVYAGVENLSFGGNGPGFAGFVAIDPGVTSEYAVAVDANGKIYVSFGTPVTTIGYVAALGVLTSDIDQGTGNALLNGIAVTTSTTAITGKDGITLSTNSSTWTFGDGALTFPDNTVQTTAYTGTVAYSNVTDSPTAVSYFTNDAEYLTSSTVVVDRLTADSVALVLSPDGTVTFPIGTVLNDTTASVVVNLADALIDGIITYSTTSTDQLAIGTYGNESIINAPYAVTEFPVTPPVALLAGDIISGAGYPVPSPIIFSGTGTWTSIVITSSDFSDISGTAFPLAGQTVTIARPKETLSFNIHTPNDTSLFLNPGQDGNIILGKDLIPVENNVQNLGSVINRWRHLWLGGGSIFIKDEIKDNDVGITARNDILTIIGSAGLKVGEFTFQDNQIIIADNTKDIIVGTTTATGYVTFNRPVKMNGNSGQRVFEVTRDGLVTIQPKQNISVSESALSIIGNAAGLQQPRNFTGTMLQITGQNGISSRVSIDAFGTNAYPVIAGRAARGTVQEPTATKNRDILFRLATQGYGDNQYVQSIGRITIEATQDFTNATAGTQVVIQTTPNGSNVITTSTVFNDRGINFDGNTNGGITFYDGSRQTTAFTGTVDVSLINNLDTAAVTSITINADGLSGSSGPGTASINNTGVIGISGTPNQVYINTVGNTTETSGHFTLRLPQDIAPTSNVTFNDVNINGNLNFLGTATILIPNTVEGTILYLGSSATNISQLDGGGIVLGNTDTTVVSILWNRNSNYWDFDGSGIRTQQLNATTATIDTNLIVSGQAHFGDSNIVGDYANAAIQIDSQTDSWSQVVFQNHSSSTYASTDFVATNEIGTDTTHYIDMGINGSNYYDPTVWQMNGANDGYLYIDSGNLAVGTTQDEIVFFTGDAADLGSIRATIDATGLRVVNTVTSAGFYGPLTGHVYGDVTGSVSGNAGSVTNGVYTNQTYNNPVWIGSLAGSKISGAVALATTVTNGIYNTDTGTVTNNMLAGSIANNKLAFSQITFTAGAGIGVSVASPSLGGSTTISNTGVTSITAGTGTHISTSTGGVTVWVDLLSGPQGAVGSQGTVGAQGAVGSQGTVGAQGAVGSQGTVGAQGSQGVQGTIGSQGVQGTTGAQGTVGAQGSQGVQGTTGAQGTVGAQGSQGVQGAVGSQGTVGAQGSQGVQGTTGAQGTVGAQGSQGVQGTTGAQGLTGPITTATSSVLGGIKLGTGFTALGDGTLSVNTLNSGVDQSQYYVTTSTRTVSNGANKIVSLFGVGAAVSSSTRYMFNVAFDATNGPNNDQLLFNITGTSVLSRVTVYSYSTIGGAHQYPIYGTVTSAFTTGINMNGGNSSNNGTEYTTIINGFIDVVSAGTVNPSFGFVSAGTNVVVQPNAFMKIWPTSNNTLTNTIIGTWS